MSASLPFSLTLTLLLPLSRAAMALEPTTVDHQGQWSGGELRWTTTVHLDQGGGGELTLARPLPAGTEIEAKGATLLTDAGGTIVGLEVPRGRHEVVLQTRQPQPDLDGAEERLLVPILAGPGLQRLQLDDLAFAADPTTGIEPRVGYAAQHTVRLRDRVRLDRAIGHHRGRYATYFTGDGALSAVDLRGDLQPAGAVSGGVMGFTAALFGGLVGLLLLASRLIGRRERAERLDRYIREEFVGPPGGAPLRG